MAKLPLRLFRPRVAALGGVVVDLRFAAIVPGQHEIAGWRRLVATDAPIDLACPVDHAAGRNLQPIPIAALGVITPLTLQHDRQFDQFIGRPGLVVLFQDDASLRKFRSGIPFPQRLVRPSVCKYPRGVVEVDPRPVAVGVFPLHEAAVSVPFGIRKLPQVL